MRLLQSKDYASMVREKGRCFIEGLRALASRHPEIGDVDGLGLALRMEMCEPDGRTPSRVLADRMFQIGLEGDLAVGGETIGLVLDIGGYYKNVITLAPSLEISESEIAQALCALEAVLVRAKSELGGPSSA
jgi:4-aminobutyrate aminotransferase-like enzyme